MSVAPIRFITIGDFLLDPNVDAVKEYRDEVLRVIRGVARRQGFNQDWMNDDMKIFINRSKRTNLFLQSIDQEIIAFHGNNLVVYAGRLNFALERKLRRVDERSHNRSREVDLSDAVTLVHHLKADSHPLSWQYLRELDENSIGVMVGDAGIQATATEYLKKYGVQGIVEMLWDEEYHRYKYVNLEGKWEWV